MKEYTNLIQGLREIHDKISSIGDELKLISDIPNDIEMKSVIIDLVDSAYSLALDIEDAAQTYADLQQEEAESIETDEDTTEELEPNL